MEVRSAFKPGRRSLPGRMSEMVMRDFRVRTEEEVSETIVSTTTTTTTTTQEEEIEPPDDDDDDDGPMTQPG